jgi:hypothetical protein
LKWLTVQCPVGFLGGVLRLSYEGVISLKEKLVEFG